MQIALIGGGPTALFVFKRLVDTGRNDFTVTIYEKGSNLGCGMPYSHDGAADEHITNVSGNEIPALPVEVSDWVKTISKDTLDKYHINASSFNDYKVLPRLLFGQYLCDQFHELLRQAKQNKLDVTVRYNTRVTDIIDETENICVVADGNQYFDKVVICTGHSWPKKHEGQIKNWFDSPYPPQKLSIKADFPVAIRGASLTAVDAIRTLAKYNGEFFKQGTQLKYTAHNPGFKLVLHTINGLLPAVRFHLEDSHLGKNTVLAHDIIEKQRAANNGFLPLDFVFEQNFKNGIKIHDPKCYKEIKDLTLEQYVEMIMQKRQHTDPFKLLKQEYAEAEKSINNKKSVYWKEQLAILSFAMNYPAKYFSAEDYLRLEKTLMPLISMVIAFIPQSSAETLMALYDANVLSMKKVHKDDEPKPAQDGGIDYANEHYTLFIDCIGQPHLSYQQIPFAGLREKHTISPAKLNYRNRDEQLVVPGIAINDRFQPVDAYGAYNAKLYILAVPFIGGYNPDYSGLDFCEAASKIILDSLINGD